MQNLKNNLQAWLPVVILAIGGLIAAGRISGTQARLVEQINIKLDKEVYDRDQVNIWRELTRINNQLERIESKVDNVTALIYQGSTAISGNQQPERPVR